ncbi:MAG: DUF4347 domain-containing protein, partial [Planctomycetaceae bacterium]|nr:DUF4347 domain-containing protein [Planctomycetaceae bacterium]
QTSVFTSEDLYSAELQLLQSGQSDSAAAISQIGSVITNVGADANGVSADPTTTVTVSSVPHQIVFVDAGVYDYQSIVADLQTFGSAGPVDVQILESDRDGIQQISEFLALQTTPVDSIHFLTHGTSRAIRLGSTWLTQETLLLRTEAVSGWASSLTESADLMFYGCDVASTSAGRNLLQSLAALTGSDVAASTDATGSAALGGNWALEYEIGAVQTSVAVSTQLQQSWNGLMATFTVTNTNDSGAGSLRQAITDANALGGTDTITFNISTADTGYVDPTPGSPLSGDEYWSIALASALPAITEAAFLDGWTQQSWLQQPVIELNGASAGSGHGLYFDTGSGGSTLRGFAINRFSSSGVYVWTGATNITIAGNHIGTDVTGTLDLGNNSSGIVTSSNNTIIGGSTLVERNVIAGNNAYGIQIANGSSNHVIQGNLIGIGTGGQAIGNTVG